MSSRSGLDTSEVKPVSRDWAYERFDLGGNLRVKGRFEAPFFSTSSWAPGAGSNASHNPSLTSTNSPTNPRKR